jgi:hypothetical protein
LAVFLAAVRALFEVFLFDDLALVAADADFVFCLVPATRFLSRTSVFLATLSL